jgi:hypothetical protein
MKHPDLTAATAPNAAEQHPTTPTSIASSHGARIPLQLPLPRPNHPQKKRKKNGNHSRPSSLSRLHRPHYHRRRLLHHSQRLLRLSRRSKRSLHGAKASLTAPVLTSSPSITHETFRSPPPIIYPSTIMPTSP